MQYKMDTYVRRPTDSSFLWDCTAKGLGSRSHPGIAKRGARHGAQVDALAVGLSVHL